MVWVNAAAQSNLSTGVAHSTVRHRGNRTHYRIGCVVAGVKANGVAAADFQHSSLFAVADRALGKFDAAGALRQRVHELCPCYQLPGI